MTDEADPCFYGVSRDRCHVGCGRWCRPSRRAQTNMMQRVAHNLEEDLALRRRLAVRHEEEADLYQRLADHPACGTPECCQTCTTTTKEPSA